MLADIQQACSRMIIRYTAPTAYCCLIYVCKVLAHIYTVDGITWWPAVDNSQASSRVMHSSYLADCSLLTCNLSSKVPVDAPEPCGPLQ